MNYIFAITLSILLINFIKIISIIARSPITMPRYKWIDPTYWWLFYPSLFYQVYWWSAKFNLITL